MPPLHSQGSQTPSAGIEILKAHTQPIPYWGRSTKAPFVGGKRPKKVRKVTKIGERGCIGIYNPPPVPVTGIAGTCRNVLPERCDSVRLNVFQ